MGFGSSEIDVILKGKGKGKGKGQGVCLTVGNLGILPESAHSRAKERVCQRVLQIKGANKFGVRDQEQIHPFMDYTIITRAQKGQGSRVTAFVVADLAMRLQSAPVNQGGCQR